MYELPCDPCRLNTAPESTTADELPARAHNPAQRYLCPECGCGWTTRRSEKWEGAALALASNALALTVALFAIHVLGWSFWPVLAAIALAYGAAYTLEQARSAVEDWLDPADSVTRRV